VDYSAAAEVACSDVSDHPGGLTREHVVWAYRLLLDRDPENEDVIGPKLAGSRNTRELRHHLITSAEFRDKNPDFAHTNDPTIVIKEINTPAGAVRLFIDLSDHVIGLSILRGQYERREAAFAMRQLAPGDTAIDVGAHIGFFTIQMAAAVGQSGRVFAFEPYRPNADLLERSIAENDFARRIVFQRAAVGAAGGTATLTFAAETLNSGGAYLLRTGTSPLPGNATTTVPVVGLDDLDIRGRVAFVKMDVEGAEPLVVRGARRLLQQHRPVILSELHGPQLARASGMTADDFLQQMRTVGYRAHHVPEDPEMPEGPAEAGHYGTAIEHVPSDAILSVVFVPA